jgi:aminoglycoside phosphotransferase
VEALLTAATSLAADAAVPQRDRLLDGEEMATRLTSVLRVPIDHCEPVKARYQVGRSLRVLYRIASGESTELVALRTFSGGRSVEVYERALATALQCGALPGVAHAPELGAVLFTFPNDRKLAGLRALADGGELVAYAPEKCATALVPGGYAKAYAGDDGDRTRRLHDSLHAAAAAVGLRLPRALSYSPAGRTLLCEAIPGRPLAELDGCERERGMHGLGAALAALHGLEPPGHAPPFERLDVRAIERAAATIARARPDCVGSIADLLDALLEAWPAAAATVCLHGDVHLKNAIVSGGAVVLIDLDQVSTGPSAADLGSLLAALRYSRVVGELTAADEQAQARAFLAGYATVREPPGEASLQWHVAAALFAERALRTVTRVRLPGLARLPGVLAEARATLGGAR